MISADTDQPKRGTLKLRIEPGELGLIDRAATVQGKNRTEFILEAARIAAEEVILGQAKLPVTHEPYQALLESLDLPPKPNERLRKTMRTPAPWDME